MNKIILVNHNQEQRKIAEVTFLTFFEGWEKEFTGGTEGTEGTEGSDGKKESFTLEDFADFKEDYQMMIILKPGVYVKPPKDNFSFLGDDLIFKNKGEEPIRIHPLVFTTNYMGYDSKEVKIGNKIPDNAYACCQMSSEAMLVWDNHLKFTNPVEHFFLNRNLGEKNSNWTLVTGYYDLTKESDANSSCRDFEHYMKNAHQTLCLNINLIIFCDPDSPAYFLFKKLRTSIGLIHKTHFVLKKFDEFPMNIYRNKITENRKKVPIADNRNTVSYYLFCMSRCAMLKEIVKSNPFGSTHFGWINLCINRMGLRNVELLSEALSLNRNKFSTTFIDYVHRSMVENLPVFFQYGRCMMCSGFYTGAAKEINEMMNRMEKKFIEYLELGYGHSDEQLFPSLYYENRDSFECYFGDYQEMITNYKEMKEHPETTIKCLIPNALATQDYLVVMQAGEFLLQSVQTDKISLKDDLFLKFIDDYFIACYKTSNQEKCYQIIEILKSLMEDEKYAPILRGSLKHILKNTDYVSKFKERENILFIKFEDNENKIEEMLEKGYKVFVIEEKITSECFYTSKIIKRPRMLIGNFPFKEIY